MKNFFHFHLFNSISDMSEYFPWIVNNHEHLLTTSAIALPPGMKFLITFSLVRVGTLEKGLARSHSSSNSLFWVFDETFAEKQRTPSRRFTLRSISWRLNWNSLDLCVVTTEDEPELNNIPPSNAMKMISAHELRLRSHQKLWRTDFHNLFGEYLLLQGVEWVRQIIFSLVNQRVDYGQHSLCQPCSCYGLRK